MMPAAPYRRSSRAWALAMRAARLAGKALLPACLLLAFSSFCAAQDVPRWEVSGSYEYDIIGRVPGRSITVTDHGAQAGLAYSINRWFRIAGQFDAGFGNRIIDLRVLPPGYRHYNDKLLLGLVGPEFVLRKPDRKLNVFAHYLTGVAYAIDNEVPPGGSPTGISPYPGLTATSWVNDVGGGVDVRLPHQASFRMLQADYMRSDFANNPHNNWRFSTGVVLRLGSAK